MHTKKNMIKSIGFQLDIIDMGRKWQNAEGSRQKLSLMLAVHWKQQKIPG
jgi:hypothetical protein